MKFHTRFALLFAVLAAAAAYFLTATFDRTLKRVVEERVSDRLRQELEHLSDDLARGKEAPGPRDEFLRRAAADLSSRITLVARDGEVLHETGLAPADVARMENHAGREEIREALERGTGESRRYSATTRARMLYVAQRLPDAKVLRMAISEEHLRQLESAHLWSSRSAILGACLLLFVIGAALSRRFAKPIAKLTRAASAVAAGDFARDLPAEGSEELRLLGGALQRMKGSLSRALAEALAERRLTAMVFERLPDGLVIVDEKLHVLEANERFTRLVGAPAPAGRALYDLLRDRALFELFEAALKERRILQKTVHLAEDSVWEALVIPLPEGSRAAGVGVLRDITRLERTEAMRRTFVADVSHELRTPIASIAVAAETLSEGGADETEVAHLLGVIRRQAERMRELIDDLMDLAQIESGAVHLEKEEVVLCAILREAAQDLAPAAREKNVRVTVEGDERVTVLADRRRLGQIVRNLLDNAVKFSPEESVVTLNAGREGEEAFFTVSDRGPGIPASERDRIFQRFYQVDRSRSKIRPGTGLGLAIVKHLVQLHAARLELESEVGRGSTFRVEFPHKA